VGHLDAPGRGLSHHQIFDAPRQARGFFEALCADNVDIGRPEEMQLIFGRRVRTPPPGGYRTRLLRAGDQVTLNAYFRHSRVKSYLKCGQAFRIETVVNDTSDLGVPRRLEHLEELSVKGRDVNRRMVDAFRGNASPSSTPSCTTDCSARSWPPTHHPHHYHYARPCEPPTDISTTTSTKHASAQLEQHLAQISRT